MGGYATFVWLLLFSLVQSGLARARPTKDRSGSNKGRPTPRPNFRISSNAPVQIPVVGDDDTVNGKGLPEWAQAPPSPDVGLPPGASFSGDLNIPCQVKCGTVPRQCRIRSKDVCGIGCYCALYPTTKPTWAPSPSYMPPLTTAPTVSGFTPIPTFSWQTPPPTIFRPTNKPSAAAGSGSGSGSAQGGLTPTMLPYNGVGGLFGGSIAPTSSAPTTRPPTRFPSARPSPRPSGRPSLFPTAAPTTPRPSALPTNLPTTAPPTSSLAVVSSPSPIPTIQNPQGLDASSSSSSSSSGSGSEPMSKGAVAGIVVGVLVLVGLVVAGVCIRRNAEKEDHLVNRFMTRHANHVNDPTAVTMPRFGTTMAAGEGNASQVDQGYYGSGPGSMSGGGRAGAEQEQWREQGEENDDDEQRMSAVVDYAEAYASKSHPPPPPRSASMGPLPPLGGPGRLPPRRQPSLPPPRGLPSPPGGFSPYLPYAPPPQESGPGGGPPNDRHRHSQHPAQGPGPRPGGGPPPRRVSAAYGMTRGPHGGLPSPIGRNFPPSEDL